MARQAGHLAVWNDERGFGFIDADDGARFFLHISSIRRIATRPRIGDRLSFAASTGRDGRPVATDVMIAGANPVRPEGRQRGAPAPRTELRDWARVSAAFLILGLLMAAVVLDRLPLWVAGVYLGMGLLSAMAYLGDKRAARSGEWRTSEKLLLSLDFAGGVAGGLLAQQMLRHKTAKASFVAATILIASLHVAALLSVLAGFVQVQ